MAKAQRQRGEIASRRYRGHPPCRKVVRLARVPYYARPRLTPFLSVHVSLGSGSIRRALADVSPSLPPLGIKPANGRKKWPHDNARSFPAEVYSLPPSDATPSVTPPSTPRPPRLAPFPCRRHIRLLAFLFPWNVHPVRRRRRHSWRHRRLYTRLLIANDAAMLNKDSTYTQ